ncbi:TraB/GumN family protein [Cohnella sp. GCM10012308]|uniref:TraB/GumN family protein n=1 Tax=Cohnella sp. GCM10012308 TaxID=3317329 RepID=UPI00361CA378
MKKIGALFLSLILAVSVFSGAASAAAKPVSVWMDGSAVQFKQGDPMVENGTTLVPMRPLLEKLGVALNWDAKSQSVMGTKSGLSFALQAGNRTAVVNGVVVTLDVAPRIVRGTTYVPLRFVAEAIGYKVTWDAKNNAVSLTPLGQPGGSTGFLWKAEKNGNTVYLLGSIHVAQAQMYPLRAEIEAAYKASQYLGVEVDLTKTDDESIEKLIADNGMYKDGTTLKDHVSPETYQALVDILKANDMPTNTFDQYEPWVVAQSIPTASEEYQANLGIDAYFMGKAVSDNKLIVPLESAESQLALFDRFSPTLQEEQLQEAINAYSASSNSGMDALTRMWVTGDETALLALIKASAEDQEYYKALVLDRNLTMSSKIEAYLNDDQNVTRMIIVGALHMLGDDGIITRLKNDGYTVTKL